MDEFSTTLQAALAPGYQLERELTGGGMSRVFVATDVALGRKVVVKVLPPELAAGVNHERFRREIQVAAQLQHPHVVPLLSAGEQGSLIWYTMPYINGHSLREAITRGDTFAIKDVVRILRDVAEALDYAHGLGVIHRDIKPGNVLLMGSHALVTDFGVAKAISASMPSSGYTSAGMAIGTPAYMAPEQIAADPAADHRMDLYALGLLGYEMLTGQVPFKESSPQQTMAAQLTRDPKPVQESRADVPPKLSALVTRLLAKLPDDRPQRASEVVSELDDISVASGATLAPLTPTRRATVARTALVGAAGISIIAMAWLLGQRTGEAAGTTFLRDSILAAESTQAIAPAATMLTSEDSMAIAKAVSSRIADRPAPRKTASPRNDSIATVAFADSVRQFVQRVMLDSMLKVEMLRTGLVSGARVDVVAPSPQVTVGPGGIPRVADPEAAIREGAIALERASAALATAFPASPDRPRRVVIALPRPSRSRPELQPLATVLADSLRVRFAALPQYRVVSADSVAAVLQSTRTVNAVQERLQADLILSIALVPARDSALMRMVQIRDVRPGSRGYQSRVATGIAVVGADPATGVTDLVARTLHQVRELETQPFDARTPSSPTAPRTQRAPQRVPQPPSEPPPGRP